MFLEILSYLSKLDSGFLVLNYLTLRAVLSTLTALTISLLIGSFFIKKINTYQIKQVIRLDGPETHLKKQGTPTMGGILILFSFLIATLIWGDFNNHYLWVVLFTAISFAGIGLVDDLLKIKRQSSDGLSSKQKYLTQSIFALIIGYWLYDKALLPNETTLIMPFFKEVAIPLGLGFIAVAYFTIVGSSNAVNLTDGLDGLAIMPVILVLGALAIFSYVTGHIYFSSYLGFPFISGTGELLIICGSLIGASIGFLWFNTYPAQVFMGDTGSLFLGAVIAVIAIIIRQEILLIIIGGIFVVETLSVAIQVLSYKFRNGKRVFLMAPLHHHFEQKGWAEPKIIVRFWMITLILVLIGLASLKVR
ncbi:Phospho-N-acetylmuramoyl-pentapeptide-transferase [hydrothermal vent metagenome]|uniref:Phospho-N-acetylmuramoyl-pentapeptide-transferase n=1 Tax=hydrothermal vent metagenome TaxID=652676 RepID=A0A1W1CPM9_9ZZZZ